MNTASAVALLITVIAAIGAELLALVFPRAMLGLLQQDPEKVTALPLSRVLALLSVFYLLALGLLAFSDNQVFRFTAVMLASMGLLLWGLRRLVLRYPALVMFEATICLVLLVNVLLSVLQTLGATK